MHDMSMLSRFANRVWPRRLGGDLEDEVQFHVDMRIAEYRRNGMSADEAAKKAYEQFGDIDSVVTNMRTERLTSTPGVLTIAALFVAVAVLWVTQQQLTRPALRTPAVRAVSIYRDPNFLNRSAPPPRPLPGPTWTQFVRQTKAFEALAKGPGTYSPGRLIDDEGKLINDKAKTR